MAENSTHSDRKTSKSGKMLVAAIDLGSTYSGYAFSFNCDFEKDPTKAFVHTDMAFGMHSLLSSRAPTILLLDNEKKFVAFGYDAETTYSDLVVENKHESYYYFRRFKMVLYRAGQLWRDIMISDDNARQIKAILVFSIAINYLKKHLMETLNNRIQELQDDDILWVLTVPAIWRDGSKQFMREAAEMAGIKNEDLKIAFEAEAASLYCMHLPMDKLATFGMTESQKVAPFTKGTKYMIVDVGGGTADFTVYEVVGDRELKELYYASEGACGGNMVDAAFENFLRKIVGDRVFDTFFQEKMDVWVGFFREFEKTKRNFKERPKETVTLPVHLIEIYNEINGKSLKEALSNDKSLPGKVNLVGDKLRVDAGLFRSWFDDTCNNTVKHVRELFRQKSSEGTNTILLVGGYFRIAYIAGCNKKELS